MNTQTFNNSQTFSGVSQGVSGYCLSMIDTFVTDSKVQPIMLSKKLKSLAVTLPLNDFMNNIIEGC